MAPRTKLNIALAAMMATLILLVFGVMQRQSNPGQAQADEAETIARRKLLFTVEDLLNFAATTPRGAFSADLFPAELEDRSRAKAYFEQDSACWHAIQTGIQSSSNKPALIPFREPNQPEPLLVFIDFDQGDRVTLKFVQDSLVDCELNSQN